MKGDFNFDVFHLDFEFLYLYDFLDSFFNVEGSNVLGEVVVFSVEDGVIKDVVDEVVDELGS